MMNQQEILRKIGQIIHELQDQQQYLSQTSKINLLELELFTANADFLIDHIEILKKLNNQADEQKGAAEPVLEISPKADNLLAEEVLTDEPQAEILEDSTLEDEAIEEVEKPFFDFSFEEEPTEMVFDFEKKVPVEEVFDRPLSNEEIKLLENKIKTLEEVKEVIVEEDFAVEEEEGPEPFLMVKENDEEPFVEKEEILSDQIEEPKAIELPVEVKDEKPVKTEAKLTLNEMLSAKKEQKVNLSKTNNTNIDLKTTISLNDKMLFIKDLFNGYNLAYSEAIEIINRFESFEAADNFLMKNYAQKNNWANKQETVDRFYDYLNKKFGA